MTTTTGLPAPRALSLAFVPALITLAITIARLALELAGGPAWLASSAGGGGRAVLGIVWLPVLFGAWFAFRLRHHIPGGKAFWLRLWKTLTVYGLLARVPVVVITILAVLGNWGTHYEKFGSLTGTMSRIGAGFAAQLGLWACIWTPLAGLLASVIALAFRPRERVPCPATP